MAIIHGMRGVKAWVLVNGQRVIEYPDIDGASDTAIKMDHATIRLSPDNFFSRFIECVSNTAFAVEVELGPHLELEHRFDGIDCQLAVDGQPLVRGAPRRREFTLRRRANLLFADDVRQINPQEATRRPLRFQEITQRRFPCFIARF